MYRGLKVLKNQLIKNPVPFVGCLWSWGAVGLCFLDEIGASAVCTQSASQVARVLDGRQCLSLDMFHLAMKDLDLNNTWQD